MGDHLPAKMGPKDSTGTRIPVTSKMVIWIKPFGWLIGGTPYLRSCKLQRLG